MPTEGEQCRALGHVSAGDGAALLTKISAALSDDGVFCGSESIGTEGHDQLQFFDDVESLRTLLSRYFPVVHIKEVAYVISYEITEEQQPRGTKGPAW